jgi:Tol biopolymer transport system component
VRDTVDPGRDDARPALSSLPAPGRLLVVSARGAWIVERDGSMRRLGDYDEASWSPNGLFVVATRGRQLVALDPKGAVRWSLARPQAVGGAEWSSDGFRVAYLTNRSLRVVAGDGTGDRLVARRIAPVTPVWLPGRKHVVTFSDSEGRVAAVDTDSGRRRWRSDLGSRPRELAWTPDGRRLVVLTTSSLRVLDAGGRPLSKTWIGLGGRPDALAVHPGGRTAAVAIRHRDGRSEVVSFPSTRRGGPPRRLFAGHGRFTDLAWSPDGRWLLVAWREADQWLFVRSDRVRKVDAVSNIGRQFDPAGRGQAAFPTIGGWCCER